MAHFFHGSALHRGPGVISQFWTNLSPSADSRIIYVSSGGNDSNDGLSTGAPKLTIGAAMALLRDGFPDQVLFKCGDTWDLSAGGGFGNFGSLGIVGGRSSTERMVIGSYGTGARPLFKTGDNDGLGLLGGGPNYFEHLAWFGLDLCAHKRDPSDPSYNASANDDCTGLKIRQGTHDMLFEDMRWRFFGSAGMDIHESGNNTFAIGGLKFRRCQSTDNYSTTGAHAQGIYMDQTSVDGVLIEECLFDYNGWRSDSTPPIVADIFSHNCYLDGDDIGDGGPNITAINNILLRASSHGMQMRKGGTQDGNYVDHCAIGLLYSAAPYLKSSGTCRNNVVLHGQYIAAAPKQYGIWFEDNISSCDASGNLIANATDDQAGSPIVNLTTSGLSLSNNTIYNWPVGSNMGSYPAPTRDLASYGATLGTDGTLGAAIALLRAQNKQNWNDALRAQAINAYVRAGFGL